LKFRQEIGELCGNVTITLFMFFAELRQVVKKTKNMVNIKWSESWINIQFEKVFVMQQVKRNDLHFGQKNINCFLY
jgi:hypothetical protein